MIIVAEFWVYILVGAVVGFIVGLTGVGGGAIMTPALLSLGFPPAVAVGTDLVYAGMTKSVAAIIHHKQSTIQWKIVSLLSIGSLPTSFLVTVVLKQIDSQGISYEGIITTTLGLTLVLTALVILFRGRLTQIYEKREPDSDNLKPFLTIITGIVLGVFVTLSSVGAGALGATALLLMHPRLPVIKVIGTDLTHAILLTAVASIGHYQLGNINFSVVIWLLIGSLPAVYIGTILARRVSSRLLQWALSVCILLLGIRYIVVGVG